MITTLTAGSTATAALKNVYVADSVSGTLEITKGKADGSADIAANESFDFVVTFDGDINSVTYEGVSSITANYTDKQIKFSLKVGDTFTIKNIPAGTGYTIHEDTKSGYSVVSDETGSIPTTGGTVSKTINNYKNPPVEEKGAIEITKTISGADAADLGEIEFKIEGPADFNGGEAKYVKYSEFASGRWSMKNIPVGEYTVTETKNGAQGDIELVSTKVNKADAVSASKTLADGKTVKFAFVNTYEDTSSTSTGTLEITKTLSGADASELGEIEFKVEGPAEFNGGEVLYVKYSEFTSGRWTMENVPAGDYTVNETKTGATESVELVSAALDGDATKTLAADGTVTFAFTNTYEKNTTPPGPTTGTLEITKTLSGANASNLGNIVFEIQGPAAFNGGNKKTVNYSEFTDGKFTMSDIPEGEYTVKETSNGQTSTYVLVSTTINGDAVTSASKTLAGGGKITFDVVNTYEDTTPPPVVTGTLKINKTITGLTEAQISELGTISFKITGPADFNGGNAKIVEFTEFADGTYILTGIPLGEYTVEEIANGETTAFECITTTVNADEDTSATETASASSTVIEFSFENTYQELSAPPANLDVKFSKLDESHKYIAQAELTLKSLDNYDMSDVEVTQNGVSVSFKLSDDKHAISFVTVDTAPSIVMNLRPGRYELTETVTPKAYLTAEAIEFTLNVDGSTNCRGQIAASGSPIIMIDKADPKYVSPDHPPIPATGEQVSAATMTGVSIIILSAICFAGYGFYRARRKKEN